MLTAAMSGGTSVDKEKEKAKGDDDDDEWYTADEGVFDKQLGRLVVSPSTLEKIEKREKERKRLSAERAGKEDEVKSATKLQLVFGLDEVYT